MHKPKFRNTIKNGKNNVIKINWNEFLAEDAVKIFNIHIEDYFDAKRKENTSYGGDFTFSEIFLSLQPHFALRSNPNEDHYLRILMDLITRLLLPSYEYNCDSVRYLSRGALVLKLKELIDKWSEPPFIFSTILEV